MKRLVALASIVLVFLPLAGFAIQIDFDSSSIEDLINANNRIIEELFKRGSSANIHPGEYIVGKHIPEGDYRAVLNIKDDFDFADILVYAKPDDIYPIRAYRLNADTPEVGAIILTSDQRLVITGLSLSFYQLSASPIIFK